MKNTLYLFSVLFCWACESNVNRCDSVFFSNKAILVNWYENDSLNESRPYIIPRLYYSFNYTNETSDSLYLVLPSYFHGAGERPNLFISYRNTGIDTLSLTDYENMDSILLKPNYSGEFDIVVPIRSLVDKYENMSTLILMRELAEKGTIHFNLSALHKKSTSFCDNKIIDIDRSGDFFISFRDSLDTAIE